MNIVHVVNQISQRTGGGSAVVPYQLAQAQARLGNEVTIFSSDYNDADQEAPEGVRLVKFKGYGKKWLKESCFPVGMVWSSFHKYDILHLHNYRTFANWIASSVYQPYVIQAHGSCQPIKARTTKPLHNFIWRQILHGAERCIAESELEVNQYLAEKARPSQCTILPIGIDLTEYRQVPERHTNGMKTVLFLGRLDKIKGLDLLIDAFGKYGRTDTRLIVAGMDTGYESEARQLARSYNLDGRIVFTGPLYGENKLVAYANADVFVMPSRYEMWGLTWLEALACGTPVIMSDKCQASGILPRECGTVVPFDSARLADAINTMLDYNYANAYRDYRRQWVKQYSWEAIAQKYIKLYMEVLTDAAIG